MTKPPQGSLPDFDSGPLSDPIPGLRRLSIRQSSATIGGQLALAGMQLASTLVLARILAPSDFGLMAMVATLVALVSLMKEIGLVQAVVQAERLSHDQATGMFWLTVVASIGVAIVTLLLAPVVAAFYDEPDLIAVTVAFSAILFVSGLGTAPHAILSRRMDFKRIVSGEVLASGVGMIAGIAVAVSGGGYWALVAISAARASVTTVYLWLACSWRPGLPKRHAGVRSMVSFGGQLSLSNLASFFDRNADDALIGWRWGAESLGQYAAAYRVLLMPLSLISTPVARVALPTLSRVRREPDRYRMAYVRMVRVISSVAVPMMGFVVVASDWVIAILLGPGWEVAATVLSWLALAGMVQPLANSTGWLFVSQGRTGEHLSWSVVSAVLAIASFVIGLPFGAVGVAIAYSVSGLIVRLPILIWWTGRRGPVTSRDLATTLVTPLALAACVIIATLLVRLALPDASAVAGTVVALFFGLLAAALVVFLTSGGRELRSDAVAIMGELRPAHDGSAKAR